MYTKHAILVFTLVISQTWSWEALPQIPSGRRAQFLVLKADGGYKYGYDTGDGSAAKQDGDASNQVSGLYSYKNAAGQNIDIKYTSGVQGFVPEGLDKILADAPSFPSVVPSYSVAARYATPLSPSPYNYASQDDQAGTGDASYNFNFDTDTYKRAESSDSRGNVQGRYTYSNEAGTHDLSYIAGENTGFVATSGSLARANGLSASQNFKYASAVPSVPLVHSISPLSYSSVNQANDDGSYAFSYSTGDSSRQESADAGNNVQGRYSYQNNAGSHDLSYVAGSQTGFLVTGGSLSKPNGLAGSSSPSTYSSASGISTYSGGPAASGYSSTGPSSDGSYAFSYSTGDSARHEQSDAIGNVKGSYSYKNAAGTHDLSYVAGSQTGFLPTGGSLSNPENVAKFGGSSVVVPSVPVIPSVPAVSSSDQIDDGVVLARTSSLGETQDDQANTGDASYSFTVDTDDYKRAESSDAAGNVRGSFSYKNNAGIHDLSYVAGSQTGFLPTGGSLSDPNAITSKIASLPSTYSGVPSLISRYSNVDDGSTTNEVSSGDASYSFTVDTDDYKRQESSDASGNVKGSFNYKNSAGTHNLDFVAGSATGFLPTGGSLSVPPGLNEAQFKYSPLVYSKVAVPVVQRYSSQSVVLPVTKTSYSLGGNAVVRSYLPPSNEHGKFGYIYTA